jgi:hypothetical protein
VRLGGADEKSGATGVAGESIVASFEREWTSVTGYRENGTTSAYSIWLSVCAALLDQ